MVGSAFLNFLFLSLHRHRSRHVMVWIMSFLIVSVLGSVLILGSALRRDTLEALDQQADVVVQKIRGGRSVDLPADWAHDFAEIPGVGSAVPRVHGRYFHEPNGTWFTIVGLDPFDERVAAAYQELFAELDLRSFLGGANMIVGCGVAEFLADHHYQDTYDFVTPEARRIEVHTFGRFPADSGLFTSDLILVEIDLAREILGIAADEATDIALSVPNEAEADVVMGKLISQQYDIRVVLEEELARAYEHGFHRQGGLFLLLYGIMAMTFALILYQRYSLITGQERRQIGLLRAVGWSMGDVIGLKLAETVLVALTAFLTGLIFSYVFVFYFQAPGLSSLFTGVGNLGVDFHLRRYLDFGLPASLFLLFMVPFVAAVLVPTWRVAAGEPVETMK